MTYTKGTKVSFDVTGTSRSRGMAEVGCKRFTTGELLEAIRQNGGTATITGRVTGEADGDGRVTIAGNTFRESEIHDVARNLDTEAPAKPEPAWQDGDIVTSTSGYVLVRKGGMWKFGDGSGRDDDRSVDDSIRRGRFVAVVKGGVPIGHAQPKLEAGARVRLTKSIGGTYGSKGQVGTLERAGGGTLGFRPEVGGVPIRSGGGHSGGLYMLVGGSAEELAELAA